jgi:GT2 family glycosyltransferase
MKISIIIAHHPSRNSSLLEEIKKLESEKVEVLTSSSGNKSKCRNELAKIASGEILVFFDDDVILRHNTIEELLLPFDKFENVAIVGGINVPMYSAGDWRETISSSLLSSSLSMARSAARYTSKGDIRETDESEIILCNMAMRRDVFLKAGGLPENIIPCEENVLINRVAKLGYKIIYNPFAVVYHERPKLFMSYFKKMFGYGKGRGIMMRRGEGAPKMLWRPNLKWVVYPIAFAGHYVSYLSGVLWGLVRGK